MAPSPEALDISVIRERAKAVFNKTPCLWQLEVAQAFLMEDRDIVCIAGTGMGKTLSFWLPLLFRPTGIQIVVTPLNLLGQQNAETLQKVGIESISISADTATHENFQAIENLKYRAVIVSPEQLMKAGGFEKLLSKSEFTTHIVGFIFDEAHCIRTWKDFRPEYKELQRLHYILPRRVPYMITSATLTPEALTELKKSLHIRSDKLVTIHTTTDRSNIYLSVRKIDYTLSTYTDLGFLIPEGWKEGDLIPPKFLIFFDNIQDSISAAKFLRNRLPHKVRHKIKWFNSDMTSEFKEREVLALTNGDTWGLCTTESFGMGMDISDIRLVIQWRASCTLSTLWQRWGRAVRDRTLQGTAILFAEKEYFDDVREVKRQRQEARKRKAKTSRTMKMPARKRQAVVTTDSTVTMTATPLLEVPQLGANGAMEECDDEGESSEEEINSSLHTTTGALGGEASEKELRDLMKPSKPEEKRQGRRDLDPAMDCLINAHLRPAFYCRRKVFNIHFDDASSGVDHRACDPSNSNGCQRCAPVPPSLCCDIHHPDYPTINIQVVPAASRPKVPARSRITKFTMGPKEFELSEALEDWREQKMRDTHGEAHLIDLGPATIMPDGILDRIVECASASKIKTLDDLSRETRWAHSKTILFGTEVIAIVHRILPLPAAMSALVATPRPLKPASSPATLTAPQAHVLPFGDTVLPSLSSSAAVTKKNKCSACGMEGHNKRNRVCVMHPLHNTAAPPRGKENLHLENKQ